MLVPVGKLYDSPQKAKAKMQSASKVSPRLNANARRNQLLAYQERTSGTRRESDVEGIDLLVRARADADLGGVVVRRVGPVHLPKVFHVDVPLVHNECVRARA